MTGELPGESWHRRACKSCSGVVKAQRVEQAIETPGYLIGVTGDGSCALRLSPASRLPLRDLIFLNEDDDIRAWLLANDGRYPLDLMLLESRPDRREDSTPTPEPADGRYRYFDRKNGDRSGQAGDNLGIQEEEVNDDDGDHDQDRGSRGSGEKSGSEDVEPDEVGESDEDDESDEENEVEGVSRIPEKEIAARIDNVSSKL